MNKVIEITIRNKVARIASSPIIVGKNKDYIVRFNFDEDWDKYDTKTARFSQDDEYQDIIFTGNECSMPALDGGKVVEIGVYAGDISTTTPAYLKVQKSIIDDDGVPAEPQPDVYAQLMERLNELEAPAAVLYTEQNLTDAQKEQARYNIGVNESLGMTGATVGQVPVVKTVDENGAPTEWEAGELPSGAYTVNLTMGVDGSITADKTFAEIKAASDDGKVVNAKFSDDIVPLLLLSDSEAVFTMTGVDPGGVFTADLTCTSDNVWSVSQDGFDAHTLGISGASVGQIVKIKTVDSSGVPTEWEPANMPSGSGGTDTSLGLTGATVGQTVKIKAVDENGAPTEWEAVDAASGGDGAEIDISREPDLILEVSKAVVSLSISEINGQPINATEMVVLWEHPGGAAYVPNYFRFNNEVKNATDSSAALANFNLPADACPSNTTAAAIFCRVKKINNGTYRYEFSGLQQNVGTLTGLNPTVYGAPYRNNLIGETSIKEFYVYQASNIQEGCKVSVWVK